DHPELIPDPTPVTQPGSEPVEGGVAETLLVEVNGQRFDVVVHGGSAPARSTRPTGRTRPRRASAGANMPARNGGGNDLVSPIQGTAIRIAVEVGSRVEAGDLVCVVEAMKMENELVAHQAGTVTSLSIEVGDGVKVGDVIATIEP